MNNITVNAATRSIVLSKKFAVAAAKYGTEEYRMLQEVRRDYPGFKVVEVARKASKNARNTYKGLTYEYMEAYISKHDKDGTKMRQFFILTASEKSEETKVMKAVSYQKVKNWFLAEFEEIQKCCQTREELIARKAA